MNPNDRAELALRMCTLAPAMAKTHADFAMQTATDSEIQSRAALEHFRLTRSSADGLRSIELAPTNSKKIARVIDLIEVDPKNSKQYIPIASKLADTPLLQALVTFADAKTRTTSINRRLIGKDALKKLESLPRTPANETAVTSRETNFVENEIARAKLFLAGNAISSSSKKRLISEAESIAFDEDLAADATLRLSHIEPQKARHHAQESLSKARSNGAKRAARNRLTEIDREEQIDREMRERRASTSALVSGISTLGGGFIYPGI